MRPLRRVSKSPAKLAAALSAMGHRIAKSGIPELLDVLGYRRQVNRKTLEGSRNPDRNAQFAPIRRFRHDAAMAVRQGLVGGNNRRPRSSRNSAACLKRDRMSSMSIIRSG